MELVVNIWPIVDERSMVIQRFAARAYAMDAPDAEIATTLKSLAKTDFILARQFPIPANFTLVSEHGKLSGLVSPADFNVHQSVIIEDALRTLETDLPTFHGVGITPEGKPFRQNIKVAFPEAPYFVVTYLLEDTAGNLRVYKKS